MTPELPQPIIGLHFAAAAVGQLVFGVGLGFAHARAATRILGHREPLPAAVGSPVLTMLVGGATSVLFAVALAVYASADTGGPASTVENALRVAASLAAIVIAGSAAGRLMRGRSRLLGAFVATCALIVVLAVIL